MAYRRSRHRRMSRKAGRASRKGGLKRSKRATRKGGLKRGGLSRRVKGGGQFKPWQIGEVGPPVRPPIDTGLGPARPPFHHQNL